jgi:hypothetical protein
MRSCGDPGKSIPAMCRVAQSASGGTSTCVCSFPPCAEALRAHDKSKSALSGNFNMQFMVSWGHVAGECTM